MKSTVLSSNGRKLIERLKTDHDIDLPPDVVIRRTYAGHHQKSSGAWSWFFYSPITGVNIGSGEKIVDLLRCKKITLYKTSFDIELMIENGDEK